MLRCLDWVTRVTGVSVPSVVLQTGRRDLEMPCDASGPRLGGLSPPCQTKYIIRRGVALPAKVRKARDKVVQARSSVEVFVAVYT